MTAPGWLRRARPLLGTVVEVGVCAGSPDAAVDAAFERVADVQACLSRFDAESDVSRFHRLDAGDELVARPATRAVLAAAARLRDATGGLFDVTLGTAAHGWSCADGVLRKLAGSVRFDLGGIAKGYAVDCAVRALAERGVAAGWINAGGDLRAFGEVDVPIWLRDEPGGGVRPFASLRDGAFATSRFGPACASRLANAPARAAHASVAAPECLWADALTKVVAATGRADPPVLGDFGASAWLH